MIAKPRRRRPIRIGPVVRTRAATVSVSAARVRHLAIVPRLLDAGVPANDVANEVPRRTALGEAIQTFDLPLIA